MASGLAVNKYGRLGRGVLRAAGVFAVVLLAVWGAGAIWFQRPTPIWHVLLATWLVLACAALWFALGLRRQPWLRHVALAFLAAGVCVAIWWSSLRPSHERVWADDVAQLLVAETSGDQLTLHNVRNFEWRTEQDYTPRWETRQYDLGKLQSADLILSYWMGPHIAHTLVSFGFSDGQRLVFSLEIRKERGEEFSALGGLFRKYEQVLIAADERDIVRTRSNARGEDVYLYSLKIPPDKLRSLLMGYVQRGEALRRQADFYNSVTSNCTTIVFEVAKRIAPNLPKDYRLLASGHFAKYVYDLGGLARGHRFAELHELGHINPRSLASDESGEDFSQAIRRGVPSANLDGSMAAKGQ